MATDITHLGGKIENDGATAQGRVSASEWNTLIAAVQECQNPVKSITYNGGTAFRPDENGQLDLVISSNNYVLNATTSIVGRTPPYKLSLGSAFKLRITVSHKYMQGEDLIPAGAVTAYYYVNGTIMETRSIADGETLDVDLGAYLVEGANSVYVHLDNGHGNLLDTLEYTPQAVNLGCSLPNFNQQAIQKGTSWPLQVYVSGSSAQVYIQIDTNTAYLAGTQSAGSTATYNIAQGLSFGTHKLKVWAAYSEDSSIQTPVIEKEYIYDTGLGTSPVIATSLVADTSVSMYTVLHVPYWIFDPDKPASGEVTLSILTDAYVPIMTVTRTVTFDSTGNTGLLDYAVSLFDQLLIGERYVRISYGDVTRDVMITIVQGSITLNEVSGYDLYLSSAGRSNQDDDYDVWEFDDYHVTFPDGFEFSEIGSGWNEDSDGNVACHIRKGHEISINYKPFETNPAWGNDDDVPGTGLGMTFSIELATRNCSAKDGSVVRCMFNNVGFEFYANSMKFASNNESLSADYKEDTRIRIDLVIEGTETTYEWVDSEGVTQTSREALMWVYVDGVYQQMKQIHDTSNFQQSTPQDIKIGSDSCDVDVYCIRAYKTALNHKGIVDNYAYDTPRPEDKIAIAQRNDIFDSSLEVSYAKLKVARPDLPIMVMSNSAIPTTKTWIDLAAISFENPSNADNPDEGAASFTSVNDQWRNQGSSSMNYPVPYRNYDLKFVKDAGGSGTIDIGGTKYDKYRIYTGEDKTKSFTLKKNYASSEMANNAISSMMFSQMAVGASGSFSTLTPAQTAYGSTKYRQSLFALPIYMFVYRNSKYEPIGQFDFLNYKTDELHLGFVSPYTWDEARAQLWEIRDNNVFWDTNYLAPYVDSEGVIHNDIFQYYEARYPKESPTTMSGEDPADFGDCPTVSDISTATDETADLLRLHNWLASTNQKNATGAAIDWYDSQGNHYTVDNARYRLAKFVDEASSYLVLDSVILYYIWREQFWMYDNGSKNLDLWTMDGTHWGCMARDCDTGFGINNEGALKFPCYIEDVDYTQNSEFVLAPLVDTRGTITGKPTVIPTGAGEVCNGQYGTLWVNIREGFHSRIQSMYVYLYNNASASKFNYSNTIGWFESHQGAWSEALFNYSSKQYHGGTPYTRWIESGLGDKKNQRRNWLYYGFRYRASKYHAIQTSQSITFREYGSGCDLQIIPYSQMYVSVGFGTSDAATTTRYRCTDLVNGVTVRNELTASVSDTIIYIYNADMYTDIGDLYKFGNIGSLDVTAGSRLLSLRLGRYTDKLTRNYVNTRQTSLSLTNCVALEELDITNCEGFGTGTGQAGVYTLDLSNQKGLKKFYAENSSITGVTLPQTPTLEHIELGSNLKTLRLVNLTGLESFSIKGESALTTINITNTPNVDTYDIVNAAITQNAPLNSVTISNIQWEAADPSVMDRLSRLTTANLSGVASIVGTSMAVSFDMKRRFIEKWGDVDSQDNGLYLTYTPYNIVRSAVSGDVECSSIGQYQYDVTPTTIGGTPVPYGNNFKSIDWYVPVNTYCTINQKTGVLNVTQVGTEGTGGTGPTVTITCQITLLDNTVVSSTKTVRLYYRSAKPGDMVFADGSYSNTTDGTKTTVGVCFYVNGTNRLMVSTANICPGGSDQWGLYDHATNGVPGLVDSIDQNYSWYDTPIPNITSSGIVVTSEGGTAGYISDATYRDESQPDGFRVLASGTAAATIGLTTCPVDIDPAHSQGDPINWGQLYTLQLIVHRDRILAQTGDEIPTSSSGESEYDAVTRCINAIVAEAQSAGYSNYARYRQFYFPPASYCYAYEPSVSASETLSDKFKAHNWWLPSCGELSRMYWYHSKGYDGANYAIFSAAYSAGVFAKFTASRYWSSSESNQHLAWYVSFSSGVVDLNTKYSTNYVRAVAAF